MVSPSQQRGIARTDLSSVGLERTSSLISSREPLSSSRKNLRVGPKFAFAEHPNSWGHVCALKNGWREGEDTPMRVSTLRKSKLHCAGAWCPIPSAARATSSEAMCSYMYSCGS